MSASSDRPGPSLRSGVPQTLIVSVPRGSGGAYTHLSRVLPRVMTLLSSWQIEVHGSVPVLQACFGTAGATWMRPLADEGYAARLRWEFGELPQRLRTDPNAMVWAPFGPPLNVRLAPRTVWMSQNLLPLLPREELELVGADHLRIRALRALLLRWARHARRTICISQHARERLARLAEIDPASIPVIPHGVDPIPNTLRCSVERLEALRTTRYVLYAGQPVPYRRTRELYAAYAILAARNPDVPPLLALGKARSRDKGYEGECLAILAPLIGAGRAHAVGQASHGDTLALMGSAHAFANPSVHEDCPNVVLEALSARQVGVYADIPAVRELAADAGLFVRNPRPEGLAEALERALVDVVERERISRAAAVRAAMFSWDRAAERTAQVLEQAAS